MEHCEELLEFMKELQSREYQVQCQALDIGPDISLEGGLESINLAHVRRIDKFSVRRLICNAYLHSYETWMRESSACQVQGQVLCQALDLLNLHISS